ncbi:methionine--tRNA ligase [Spiroplasma endosymbiont of Amphibalanus improvisus]|uniref:methionine--tRNA ligase n=1 Tax=Spiroplasma endosymbiont of Amphibalanus improvisus TaxID=3066327 RepID=UPI00313DAB3D
MPKNFYITTPIYYPSANLHLGHAYTTVVADVIKRYKKMSGYNTYFVTGTDEHGQKIEKKAFENNETPIEFVNKQVEKIIFLWDKLGIQYDKFIRTTQPNHEKTVQKIFTKLYKEGLIYKGNYDGLYCESCEEYLTLSNIEEGVCKVCKLKPIKLSEENYYFKVTAFKNFIIKYLNDNPNFVSPEKIKKEVMNNFLENNLSDLSITRSSIKWGINIKEDDKHTIYVWFDALSNYLTALDYLNDNDSSKINLMEQFWSDDTEIVQFFGKEISRFHIIYWPSMLKALNLRMPTTLIAHGWILFKDGKMSKSRNNVIDPLELMAEYSRDALRLFLTSEISYEKDGIYSNEIFFDFYNNVLANNIGNLSSRVINMAKKYFDSKIPDVESIDSEFYDLIKNTIKKYKINMDKFDVSNAIKVVIDLSKYANKFIEETKPWVMAKEKNITALSKNITALSYVNVVISFLLSPVLIDGTLKNLNLFDINLNDLSFDNITNYKIVIGKTIKNSEILYQRKI